LKRLLGPLGDRLNFINLGAEDLKHEGTLAPTCAELYRCGDRQDIEDVIRRLIENVTGLIGLVTVPPRPAASALLAVVRFAGTPHRSTILVQRTIS